MRSILYTLTQLLGESQGVKMFEQLCAKYNVTINDPAPDAVKKEVYGVVL